MSDNLEAELDISVLRLRVAVNLFKSIVLGDLHVAGRPQTSAVFEAIAKTVGECALSDRTWQSWFSDNPCVPKIEKIKVLDTLAASMFQVPGKKCVAANRSLPVRPFSELVHGGLVRRLLAPSKSKQTLPMLIARATDYEPLSPLHLHLDAIEVDALVDGLGEVPWVAVKAIGAQRILEILADRWGPRHGTVYSELSSDLRLEWDAASPEDRTKIREYCSKFKPDLFEHYMRKVPQPDWPKIGVEADVSPLHIYKVLFSLAGDPEFLVADRLEAWSLDLATSAFAMHALAWTDRYTTFGAHVTDEMMFWGAFDQLLFEPEPPDLDDWDLQGAMAYCNVEGDIAAYEMLLRGRDRYRLELDELGVSAAHVRSTAMRATHVHRLVYVAG